ncbi:hypothetical protein D8S78_03355 [Natrialba swarupiae]|nr:hypothetical protein [Natrialba swarupiae]
MARVRLEAGAISTEISTDEEDDIEDIEEVAKIAMTCQDWQFSEWAVSMESASRPNLRCLNYSMCIETREWSEVEQDCLDSYCDATKSR